MERFTSHARFFSSLDQIEDRLAFEKKKQKLSPQVEPTPESQLKESNFSPSQSDSMGSPLRLANPNPKPVGPHDSGPALDFLSDTETQQEEENKNRPPVLEERDGDETNLIKHGGGSKFRCVKKGG